MLTARIYLQGDDSGDEADNPITGKDIEEIKDRLFEYNHGHLHSITGRQGVDYDLIWITDIGQRLSIKVLKESDDEITIH